MSKNDFNETKKLLKKITIELAEIQKMLNELQNVTKKKANLEKLKKRRTLYIQ
jgi:uncharacterized phage infection (PIP) family protein YhgE